MSALWFTSWKPSQEIKDHSPPRHTDYRDSLPEDLQTVYEIYQPVVRDGAWTFGLCEMWFPKAKAAKRNVHIPCWDSFKWNPLLWRGICFGRTFEQCFWTGLRQTRWARAVYAANLGREYIMPVVDISKHDQGFKSDIKALCIMYCALSTVLSCGFGQLFSLCGNFLVNFGALYSCHAREKIRRKYNLPPTFGLPPGVDDCLVHFLCMYCASHQEIRELAVRGVDGPGMHILDVLPNAWDHIEGHEKAVAARQAVVGAMLAHPPKLFKPRVKAAVEAGPASDAVAVKAGATAAAAAMVGEAPSAHPSPVYLSPSPTRAALGPAGPERSSGSVAPVRPSAALKGAEEGEELGWLQYRPPPMQEMGRMKSAQPAITGWEQLQGRPAALQRAWSIAY